MSPSNFTMTLSDLGAIAGIFVVISTLLGLYVKLFVEAALVRQENRLTEKIKLQFAQKEITDLQMKEFQKDIDELKRAANGT
jgi:hypothetical protein